MDITVLKDKVNSKLKSLAKVVETKHKLKVPKFVVAYDLKGIKVAGQAGKKGLDMRIRLHPHALKEFGDDYINDTVVHEFAHIIQFENFPGSKPHGTAWKSIMRGLGNDPTRCHSMNLASAIAKNDPTVPNDVTFTKRQVKTFTYKCSCSTHLLTSIRHNKVMKGMGSYFCKKCGSTLVRG